MNLKLSVEMLYSKHYSDSEMHLKIILPYINTLCIGPLYKKIVNNHLPPASVFSEHRDGKQAIY